VFVLVVDVIKIFMKIKLSVDNVLTDDVVVIHFLLYLELMMGLRWRLIKNAQK
jgi:hypothetical protein